MKKNIILTLAIAIAAATLCSCSSARSVIMPRAVNTMNVENISSLNLNSSDYTIFNTITATSTIYYTDNIYMKTIVDENNEFKLIYTYNKKTGWRCKCNGVLKFGFFGSDYNTGSIDIMQPEEVARRLAIYRAMNLATVEGADALVEPTISTNVVQEGTKVIFQSTVTAKMLKLKSVK